MDAVFVFAYVVIEYVTRLWRAKWAGNPSAMPKKRPRNVTLQYAINLSQKTFLDHKWRWSLNLQTSGWLGSGNILSLPKKYDLSCPAYEIGKPLLLLQKNRSNISHRDAKGRDPKTFNSPLIEPINLRQSILEKLVVFGARAINRFRTSLCKPNKGRKAGVAALLCYRAVIAERLSKQPQSLQKIESSRQRLNSDN